MEWMDFPQFSPAVEAQIRRWLEEKGLDQNAALASTLQRFLSPDAASHPTAEEIKAVLEKWSRRQAALRRV